MKLHWYTYLDPYAAVSKAKIDAKEVDLVTRVIWRAADLPLITARDLKVKQQRSTIVGLPSGANQAVRCDATRSNWSGHRRDRPTSTAEIQLTCYAAHLPAS